MFSLPSRADHVDRRLDLAEIGIAGVELQAHAGVRRESDQRVVIDVAGRDLDGMAAKLVEQFDLVVESHGREERQPERDRCTP